MEKMIIAEVGSVHDGSFGNAKKLIELAAKCGATAVKFQTHIASAETLKNAPMPNYFKGEDRYSYFNRTGFSKEQWLALAKHAKENNIKFLSSPFSIEAVDLLEDIGVSIYKIPSGEVTNIPMLEHIANTGKMVLLSSGMSSWQELDLAVKTLTKNNKNVVLMQCSSVYPCPTEQVGLNVMLEMKKKYNLPVGFSDHTLGSAASVAAAALGAVAIEKHITFSKDMYGSDAKHSMEPDEFKKLCKDLREVWNIIDNPVDKTDIIKYKQMKTIFEKSIVAKQSLQKGTIIEKNHFAFKKPGDGIRADRYKEFIGKTLNRYINIDEQFKEEDFL